MSDAAMNAQVFDIGYMIKKSLALGQKKISFRLIGQGLDSGSLTEAEAQSYIDLVVGKPGVVALQSVLARTGRKWFSLPGARGCFARFASDHF